MKPSFLFVSTAAAALLTAAAFIVTTAAQVPQGVQDVTSNPPPQPRTFPAPTNLKVLPRELTGEQVHHLMEQWTASLGTHCNSCHAEDRENIGPDGRPLLNFAADSKPMKAVARTMFTMTEEINTKYVASIDNSGVPVTCGTCHRGHLGPEPFVTAPDKRASSPQVQSPSSNSSTSHEENANR